MNWQDMLWGSGTSMARTAVVGVLAYLSLIVLLRLSGKRTLSKFNAFDFVVTIALGSTLATILLSREVSLAQGVLALFMLLALQFVITWLSVRSSRVRELVKGEPTLLVYQGHFLDAALRTERVTREEVVAAVRAQGVGSIEQVDAAVLETDGTITAVQRNGGVAPEPGETQ